MQLRKLETTADLKSFLLDQIGAVARGEVEPKKSQAMCAITQKVCSVMRVEMQAASLARKLEGKAVPSVALVQDKASLRKVG